MPSPPEPRKPPSSPGSPGGYLAAEEARRRMTAAHIALRRGQIAEAERMVQEFLAQTPEDADALELWGDVKMAQNRFEEAATAYRQALERDPGRTAAEAKMARATLRQSENQRKQSLGIAYASEGRNYLQGHSEDDRAATTRLAIISAVLPGMGQILGGEFVKGGILLAVYALGCLLLTYSGIRLPLGLPAIFALTILTLDWVYAVVDAARSGKTS